MAPASWTLAVTKPQQQALAVDNCQQQGFEVIAPRFKSTSVNRGKVVVHVAFLFPSYLFVAVVSDAIYGALRATRGVSRVLLISGQPATCRHSVVQNIIERMDEQGFVELPSVEPVAPAQFRVGQRLRIADKEHVMFGRYGICQGMDARQRVKVLMSLMGRKVPVQLMHSALAAA